MNFAGFLMNKVIALAIAGIVMLVVLNAMDSSIFSLAADFGSQETLLTAENKRAASQILNGGLSDFITR